MSLYQTDVINLDSLIDKLGDAVAIANHDMILVSANNHFANYYGLKPEQLIGKNIFDYYPDFKTSVFYQGAEETMLTGLPSTRVGYSNNLKKWIVVRTAKYDDFHTIWSAHSLSKDFNQSAYLSDIDTLTSLNNRYSLEVEMSNLLQYNQSFSFILLDVLKFKSVNDAFGTQTGNLAIMEVAARIKRNLSDNHKVYRFDGTTFAILTPSNLNTQSDIDKIISDFKKPFIINNSKFELNISIGFSCIDKTNKNFATIISDTEEVLKLAKKHKNSSIEFFESYKKYNDKKIIIANELKNAIAHKNLIVYYQPQLDLHSNSICGAEALIRWKHPIKGLVSPFEFLPIAQEFDLMAEIDRYVISQVAIDSFYLKNLNIDLPISINLSSTSLVDHQTFDFFSKTISSLNLDFNKFIIEITENNFIDNLETSIQMINKFSNKKSLIAIDDFGNGYSSFDYILNYTTNHLKIDKKFISNIDSKPVQKKIVANLIKMCQSLNIKVVAEGVETISEFNTIKEINCDIIQGYFFSKPIEFLSLLQFINNYSQNKIYQI